MKSMNFGKVNFDKGMNQKMFTITIHGSQTLESLSFISSRIMVLDSGKIKEMDAPQTLLANKESVFYSLCKDAGLVD